MLQLTQMNLGNNAKWKKPGTKPLPSNSAYLKYPEGANAEAESRGVAARFQGGGPGGGDCFMRTGCPLSGNKVPELARGDSCATLYTST